MSALVTTVGGLVVAFSASWRLTLTMLAFIPIVLIVLPLIIYCLGGNDCDKATTCYAEVGDMRTRVDETLAGADVVTALTLYLSLFAAGIC